MNTTPSANLAELKTVAIFWAERVRAYQAHLAAVVAEAGQRRAQVEAGVLSPVAVAMIEPRVAAYQADLAGAIAESGRVRAQIEDAEARTGVPA